MERQRILERFAEYAKQYLVPLADPEVYPVEERDRAVQYQNLMQDARWTYRRLRAAGDAKANCHATPRMAPRYQSRTCALRSPAKMTSRRRGWCSTWSVSKQSDS